MSDIFISHIEEDSKEAIDIASRLEAKGYSTWYYERDAKAGLSYLEQVAEAIGKSQVFMLLISEDSVFSTHVDRELVSAYEKDKLFIPLLKDVTFVEFEDFKPTWKLMLGPAVAEPLTNSVDLNVQRLIQTLKEMGVQAMQKEDVQAKQEEVAQYEERKIFVRLLLGPEALVDEIRSSFDSGSLKCVYRLFLRGEYGPWLPASIIHMPGGVFVNLREIPEHADVQLEVVIKGRTLRSNIIAVDTIYINLWDEA
jgi:hypothetical protein